MTTQQIYQSDAEASLQLTTKEQEAAKKLLRDRPTVLPGTRAILDRAEALAWYHLVTKNIRGLGIADNPAKVRAFCDLAGVAD